MSDSVSTNPPSNVDKAPGEVQLAAQEVGAGRPGRHARPYLAAIAIGCALLFVVDALVVTGAGYTSFDRAVELFVQNWPWGPVAYAFGATNALAGTAQIIFGVVVAAIFAVWDRRAGWLLLIGSGASLIDNLLKVSFQRHRPTADLVNVVGVTPGYSFPSGHAVFFTWLAVMVAAALAPRVKPGLRPLLWTAAVLLILIACLGRVYVGAHWPTDVLGGLLIGLGWSALVLWLPERWLPTPSRTWLRFGRRSRVAA